MMKDTEYKGKISIGDKHTLSNRISAKLEKSGMVFLDFNGGDVAAAKVGISKLKLHDKLTGNIEWAPSSKKGHLELTSTHVDKVEVIVKPPLPLPADLMQVDLKIVARPTLDACEVKVTVNPLKKTATIELIKKMNHKLCKQAKLNVNANNQSGVLTLTTPAHRQFDVDHSLELSINHGLNKGSPTANVLYTAGINKELSAKLKLNNVQNKNVDGTLSAELKLSKDTKAVANVPITSLNSQGLGKPTFVIETTYVF